MCRLITFLKSHFTTEFPVGNYYRDDVFRNLTHLDATLAQSMRLSRLLRGLGIQCLQMCNLCVAVCCSVLQYDSRASCEALAYIACRYATCVLQYVAVCCSVLQCVAVRGAVCCSVLQCVAVCCSVLQCVAVCCSVLQYAAVCCSVLQCVAVCCSVILAPPERPWHTLCTDVPPVCCSMLQYVAVCCSVL